MSDRIRIEIETDLQEIVPPYLENMRNHVRYFKENLEKGDFEKVRERGHNIKGSGGGYGFDRITELGRIIENAAKDQDGSAAVQAVDDLVDFLDRLEVVYI